MTNAAVIQVAGDNADNQITVRGLEHGHANAVQGPFGLAGKEFDFAIGLELSKVRRGASQWSIGMPLKLTDMAGGESRIWLDQAGRKLGVNLAGDHAAVIDLNDPTKRVRLQPHPKHHYVALSPDGRWAATGTFQGNGVRVCDATTGELAADLIPEGVSATVAFSPDGKWLVSGTGIEYCFFEVGTWQLSHRVARDRAGNRPGHIAFTRDGRLAAIAHSRPLVDLIDPHTGRLFATLEPPNPGKLGWLSFAPDGGYLAAVADSTIHLWDVCHIREQLAEMRLDWRN